MPALVNRGTVNTAKKVIEAEKALVDAVSKGRKSATGVYGFVDGAKVVGAIVAGSDQSIDSIVNGEQQDSSVVSNVAGAVFSGGDISNQPPISDVPKRIGRRSAGLEMADNIAGVGHVVGGAGNLIQSPTNLAMSAYMPSLGLGLAGGASTMLGGGVGRALNWVGDKTNVESIGSAGDTATNLGAKGGEALNKAKELVMAPFKFMRETPVEVAGEKAANGIAGAMERAGEAVSPNGDIGEKVGEKLVNGAQSLRSVPAAVGEKFNNTIGEHVPEGVKDFVGKQSVYQLLRRSGSVLVSAKQTTDVVSKCLTYVETLREMQADIKGVDIESVSAADVLFGSVEDMPPLYREARGKLVDGVAPASLTLLLSAYANYKMAGLEFEDMIPMLNDTLDQAGLQSLKGVATMIQIFGVPMATSFLVDQFNVKNPVLDSYRQVKDVYNATGQVPSDIMAEFIATSSPYFDDMREHVSNSAKMDLFSSKAPKNQRAMSLLAAEAGERYKDHAPGDVVKAIASGEVAREIYQVSEELSEQQRAKNAELREAIANNDVPSLIGLTSAENAGPVTAVRSRMRGGE